MVRIDDDKASRRSYRDSMLCALCAVSEPFTPLGFGAREPTKEQFWVSKVDLALLLMLTTKKTSMAFQQIFLQARIYSAATGAAFLGSASVTIFTLSLLYRNFH